VNFLIKTNGFHPRQQVSYMKILNDGIIIIIIVRASILARKNISQIKLKFFGSMSI
jgi:hypothetical protein